MKKIFVHISMLLLIFSCLPANAQNIEYIKVSELEAMLQNPDNKLFVVNFWATWCAPCIKEFPLFEKVSKDYNTSKVEFIMISLDFPSQAEKQLMPFLKKNKVSLRVVLMNDLDYNSWIDKVDKSWQGDIPATLVFNNVKKSRQFHTGEVDEQGLRKMINAQL